MTAWEVSHDQWEDWASAAVVRTELEGDLDAIDAEIRGKLRTHMFPTGDDETLVREAPEGLTAPMEEMETVIRVAPTAPEGVDTDEPTVVRRAPTQADDQLSVELQGAAAGELSVELKTPPPDEAADDDDDDMFIPVLTRPAAPPSEGAEPEPAAPAPEPPTPQPVPVVTTSSGTVVVRDPVAPERVLEDVTPAQPMPNFGDGSAVGVIGPPPPSAADSGTSGELGPPPEPERLDPGSSQTSGVIQAAGDTLSGNTLIPTEAPEPVVPKSKIVIDPSASGVFEQVEPEELDESDFVEEEPVELEVEAVELEVEAVEVEAVEPEPDPEPAAIPPVAPPAPASQPSPPVAPPAPPPAAVAEGPARTGATLPPPPAESVWLEAAFGEHSFALLSHNRPQRIGHEVDFIVASAGLPAGARVLDVGCGDGAHALAFAARGMSVVGVDASPAQLGRARATAERAGAKVRLVQGDMRELPIADDDTFDLVVCLGSTLGFFEDAVNAACVVDMASKVAPGGHLVVQVFNRDRMVGRLPARSWWQGQGCLVLDEARFDSRKSRMHVHRTMVFEDGRQFDVNIQQRAYGAFELEKIVSDAGLSVVEVSGSIHTRGTIYGAMSPDIWLVARAPAG